MEGLLAETSTGANVVAALKIAESLSKDEVGRHRIRIDREYAQITMPDDAHARRFAAGRG